MAKILESALRLIKSTQNVDTLVVNTLSSDVIYRIPKSNDTLKIIDTIVDKDYITIKAIKIDKIVPVSVSPLDAFRGRGLHSSKLKIIN